MSGRSRLALAGAVCGLSVALIAILWWRSGQLDVAARKGLVSIIDDDPAGLYALRSPSEGAESGLTDDSFKDIWVQLVKPRLARVTFSKELTSQSVNSPPTEGYASVEATLPDGSKCPVSMVVWTTEMGPKMTVLWDLLTQMWILDYATEHPREFHKGSTSKADMKLQGFRHDRAKLEAIGIKGMVNRKNRFLTWDGVDEYFVKEAEARRAFVAKQGMQDPG